MKILGIETSCDECSVAVVEKGKNILSHVIATQIEHHAAWNGVVPEIASRLHVEWIDRVSSQALSEANLSLAKDIDAIAVASEPGLVGSLLVGLSYAKALAWSAKKPWVGVNHVLAHLYAPHIHEEIAYPYLGLIVSGGHSLLCQVDQENQLEVLGTTLDDACGEAFDKVAKYYGMGYPGGKALDERAKLGNPRAFAFPRGRLYKRKNPYDVSYSGLKTAVINQLEQFRVGDAEMSVENIAASFQKVAIDMLVDRVLRASKASGIQRLVLGGGVSANSYLRRILSEQEGLECHFPPIELCTDNGAMIAGLGYREILRGKQSDWNLKVSAKNPSFRHSFREKALS